MSNRVEDLERQVTELQAAVNGLTEELVELKERTRQVETAEAERAEADAVTANTQPAAAPIREERSAEPGTRTTHSDDHVDVVTHTDGTGTTADDAASNDDDDIVVHEETASTPDADPATDADGDGSDGTKTGDSDIIIA